MLGRILGLLSIPLTGLALWGLIRQTGKERPLRLSTPLVGLVMAPITLIVNLVFLHQAAPGFLGPALLLFGLGLGVAWGQTTRVYARERRLVGKRSVWHLAFWGASYAMTQLLATVASAQWVSAGLAAMFLSAGSTLGTNLSLLVRQLRMRKALAAEAASSAPGPGDLPERFDRRHAERTTGAAPALSGRRSPAPSGLPERPARRGG
jgi:hypothetical protein